MLNDELSYELSQLFTRSLEQINTNENAQITRLIRIWISFVQSTPLSLSRARSHSNLMT